MAPVQSNLRWVYHQTDRVPVSAEQIRAALARHQSAFPLSISAAIQTPPSPRLNPFNMLVSGWLYCPIDQAVSPATHLHLIQEENHVWFRITQEHDF
ncbi:hypothetical protein [Paludibacterium denitrificans]|uniref:hypothetical protein n=1 Tax=Paludibacterium denitrificans TaxID=2675226 RepID=UPI001E30E379|nr:hypothetical protein [Paludibacterium denitrificans]